MSVVNSEFLKNDEAFDTALAMAVHSGHLEAVQDLLKNANYRPSNNVWTPGEPLAPLLIAAREGHLDIVKELLSCSDVHASDSFHISVQNGNTDCAEAIRSYIAQRDKDLLNNELNVSPGMEQRQQRRM